MEILKTSEALETQILEDARKKANRILEAAEKECAKFQEDSKRKLEEETRHLTDDTERTIVELRQELSASLPLDFRRIRLAFLEDAISRSLGELFAALPVADIARLIGLSLMRVSKVFRNARVVAYFSGLTSEDARRIVRESIPGTTIVEMKPLEGLGGGVMDTGIVVEKTDGRTRYRGTLKEMTALLMEEYREELAAALLGKDA